MPDHLNGGHFSVAHWVDEDVVDSDADDDVGEVVWTGPCTSMAAHPLSSDMLDTRNHNFRGIPFLGDGDEDVSSP